MNLFQINNGTKQYGARTVFESAVFSVNQGEHIGVIGPNGAGKTTLFKIISGIEELDSGQLIQMQNLRIGYLEQESDWDVDIQVEKYLEDECIKPIWELKQLGLSLGLTEAHFQSQVYQLSGGFRMRMKLLYLIGLEPDLLLLDEPTNFLDLETTLALESFLQDYKQAFLLISHDREFLKRTTEYTLEVEAGEITKFPGNIEDYFEQKAELMKMQLAKSAQLENKRKHLQEFVDRFKAKASKARQAQSRMKQLDKMESIDIKKIPPRAQIQLFTPLATGKEVVRLESATLGYPEKVVIQNLDLIIEKGKKVGIVGPNGAGKSTLLKTLAQKISPLKGRLELGYNVTFSYFAQHLAEDLHQEDTVFEALQKKTEASITQQDVLNMAGSLLFAGDAIRKKIKVLSGGEKTRVALGQVLLQRNSFLLLDEPTNHLDFDTVNALAQALAQFAGTIAVVSHDRAFLKTVTSAIIEVNNGQVRPYPGTYDEYLWSVEKGAFKEATAINQNQIAIKPQEKITSTTEKFNYKEEVKKLNSDLKSTEKNIAKSEEQIQKIQTTLSELNQKLIDARGMEAAHLAKESHQYKEDLELLEEKLLVLMETEESIKQKLNELRT